MTASSSWLNSLIRATEKAAALDNAVPCSLRELGGVEPAPQRGPGWYRVTGDVNATALAGSVIGLSVKNTRPVTHVMVDGEITWVRSGIATGDAPLRIYAPVVDAVSRSRALARSLRSMSNVTLAEQFSSRRLTPVPAAAEPRLSAFVACTTPGLRMIWTPVETGVLDVLAAAARYLVEKGNTVLFVAPTDAVANAVTGHLINTDAETDYIVHVGTPNVVTSDVCVESVANKQVASERLTELAECAQMYASGVPQQEYDDARSIVDAFDKRGYSEAIARLDTKRQLAAKRKQLVDLTRQHDVLLDTIRDLNQRLLIALWVEQAYRELSAADARDIHARELRQFDNLGWMKRARQRDTLTRIRRDYVDADTEYAQASENRALYEVKLVDAGVDVDGLPQPDLSVSIDQLVSDVEGLADEYDQTVESCEAIQLDIDTVRAEVDDLASRPLPDVAQLALITEAKRAGVPQLVDALPELRLAAGRVKQDLVAAVSEYDSLWEATTAKRDAVVSTVIRDARVVVSTVPRMLGLDAVRDKAYDFVFVMDAGRCRVPETVAAVGRAGVGAVLVGMESSDEPSQGDRHLDGQPLAHFHVYDAASASSQPGCVALVNANDAQTNSAFRLPRARMRSMPLSSALHPSA